MPIMVPTAQLLSTMDEPSRGSQHTVNLPLGLQGFTSGSSSDAPHATTAEDFTASHMIWSGDDVHGELRVAEGVGGALDSDERGAERLGDVRAGVELLLDHGLDLEVRALGVEHGVEGIVRFLLLRGGVEGGTGGAVGVAVRHAHVALERARRLDGGARGAAGRGGRADRDGGHGEGLFVREEASRFERGEPS